MSCKDHNQDYDIAIVRAIDLPHINADKNTCKCHSAVMRTYKTLRGAGSAKGCAISAAKIVYAHHHPEECKMNASLVVECWVNAIEGSVH